MKKIMFSDKYRLTQAVLEGRKTQTRRVINNLDKVMFYDFGIDDKGKQYASFAYIETNLYVDIYLPYQVGDVVAIAQRYKDIPSLVAKNMYDTAGWDNKMFTRAEYMLHHIKITNVRVERLQSISDEDCIAEGIYEDEKDAIGKWVKRFGFDDINDPYGHWHNTPKEAYASLIDKVGKRGTWESNPYVFVYEFELID